MPCIGKTDCEGFCEDAIQENPFRDGCAGIGVEDESLPDDFRLLVVTDTFLKTDGGFNA